MRIYLVAGENELYTNGEIYGTEIYLAEGMNEDDFYTISREEYERIEKDRIEKENLMLGGLI